MADAMGEQLVFEVLLWATPTTLAVGAAMRAPRGRRVAWWVVSVASAVITADKALDVQGAAMKLARVIARAVAPEVRSGGGQQLLRALLLAGAAAAGMGLVWLLARLGRPLDGARRLSLSGLCVVIGLLAARLMEGGDILQQSGALAWTIELVAWLLVTLGAIAGLRRARRDEPG